MSSAKLEHVVSVRFTAEEVDELQRLAAGEPISRFIRQRALEDARTSIGPCEMCSEPIVGTEYRVRHINEQHWNSSFHTDRWVYAHERCYQAYLTSLGAVS